MSATATANGGSPPPSPTAASPPGAAASTPRVSQGVQLLPLLTKYFKITGLLLLIWMVGYFGFSATWVLIGMFFYVLNEEYRKSKDAKKDFALQAVLNEKKAILARVDELPSWVYFPDVERAEWLNKMLKQMWPYIGEYIKNYIKTSVEPMVGNSLPASLKPFKFERIDLGDIPPRIGGVKVYIEHCKRDEIIMDMELFYASDSEINVSVKGVNAGIKDLTLHGTVRIVMKPLVNNVPIIGGMNVFFLNQPAIDFDLTNAANILDVPLLSSSLRTIVEDYISYFMVLPNKIPIVLAPNVSSAALRHVLPQGVLRIHCVAGRDLKRADVNLFGKGKSDPYLKLYVGAQTYKTKVRDDTINPVWNEYFEAAVDQKFGQVVEIECLDKDPGEDDELGTASIDIEQISKTGSMDSWLPLENVSTGMLHIRALWLHLSKNPLDLAREAFLRNERVKREEQFFGKLNGQEWLSQAPKYARIAAPQVEQANSATLLTDEKEESEQEIKAQSKTPKRDTIRLKPTIDDMESGSTSEQHLASAILSVTLDSAKSLPRQKKSMGEPSSYVKLSVGNETKKSMVKNKTADPTWEENFQFLVNDPNQQDLSLEVLDSGRNDKKLGTLQVPLKNLLTATDLTLDQPFVLRESGSQSKIVLHICLRILTSEMPTDWAHDVIDHTVADPVPEQPASNAGLEEAIPSGKPTTPAPAPDTAPPASTDDILVSEEVVVTTEEVVACRGPGAAIPENLRHRGTSSQSKYGRLELTIRYSRQRHKLVLVVHKGERLIECDEDGLADPYVRIYLTPSKSKSSKRKTQAIKNELNPIFDETFEWSVTPSDLESCGLDIKVKNHQGMFSRGRSHMGDLTLNMSSMDLSRTITEWFELEEPSEDD